MSGVKIIVSSVAIRESVVARNIFVEFGGVARGFISSTASRKLARASCAAASRNSRSLSPFQKNVGAKTYAVNLAQTQPERTRNFINVLKKDFVTQSLQFRHMVV